MPNNLPTTTVVLAGRNDQINQELMRRKHNKTQPRPDNTSVLKMDFSALEKAKAPSDFLTIPGMVDYKIDTRRAGEKIDSIDPIMVPVYVMRGVPEIKLVS